LNEKELFVSMLDENGANQIFKKFNETIPGKRRGAASLEEKKRYILNIFQSRTPKMMRARQRNRPDPFYFYLNTLPINIIGDINFNKSLVFIREARNKLPDYVRFGILLVKFPEEVRSNLKRIHENILNEKDPLDIYKFDDEDEFEEYFNASRELSITKQIQDFLNNLIGHLSEDEERQFNIQCEKLKSYSLMDYWNEFWDLKEEYSPLILNLAFIQTHTEENEKIQLLLLFEAVTLMLKKADITKVESLEEDFSHQLKLKKEQNTKLENKLQEQINKVELIRRRNEAHKREKTVLQKRIKELEIKERQLVEFEKRKQDLQSAIDDKKEVYEQELENKEVQLETLYKEKLREMEIKHGDYVHLHEILKEKGKNKFNNFAIICSEELKIIKQLFPENTIVLKKEDQYLQELLMSEETKFFYIIDHNLSREEALNYIILISGQGKKHKLIKISNVIELMNFIGYLNHKERGF